MPSFESRRARCCMEGQRSRMRVTEPYVPVGCKGCQRVEMHCWVVSTDSRCRGVSAPAHISGTQSSASTYDSGFRVHAHSTSSRSRSACHLTSNLATPFLPLCSEGVLLLPLDLFIFLLQRFKVRGRVQGLMAGSPSLMKRLTCPPCRVAAPCVARPMRVEILAGRKSI